MRKIIIVEDNDSDATRLLNFLDKFEKEHNEVFEIARYSDGYSFLNEYLSADIVFLDIEMPGIDGMSAARELRKKDNEVTIVFMTNMSQMAIQGYEVAAFDFILKPISYKSFALRFSRVLKVLRKEQGEEIWVVNNEGKRKIRTCDIMYIETMRHVLIFHLINEEIKATGTLLSFQQKFEGGCFSMCNRSEFLISA